MGGESIKPIRKRIHVYFLMTAYGTMKIYWVMKRAKNLDGFYMKQSNIQEFVPIVQWMDCSVILTHIPDVML